MKKTFYLERIVMVCAAVTGGVAFGAASDLPQRDSSTFDFKYEMESLPTTQDLDGDGFADFKFYNGDTWLTASGLGYAIFDCSQANRYIGSDTASGTAGSVWQGYGASEQTGFTIETRLMVTAETAGTTAAFCLWANVANNLHGFLNFKTNALLWGTSTVLTNMDTKSTFHTYRIAQAAGSNVYSLWCDGKLVRDNLGTGFSGNIANRLLIGSIGSNYRGGARVAWLRFTKGGYAPKITEKDSVEFAHRYEMNSTDTRFSPTATASDWEINPDAAGSATLSDGVLSVVQPSGKMRYYQTSGAMDSAITASSPFTLEVRTRIVSAWFVNKPVLNLFCGTPRASGCFFIGTDRVCWNHDGNIIWRGDNTDKGHVFRITYDGDTEWGFTLWRDGEPIGQNLPNYATTGNANYARFGIASGSSHGGSFDVDYIRWTTDGVFAPYIPPNGTLMIFR